MGTRSKRLEVRAMRNEQPSVDFHLYRDDILPYDQAKADAMSDLLEPGTQCYGEGDLEEERSAYWIYGYTEGIGDKRMLSPNQQKELIRKVQKAKKDARDADARDAFDEFVKGIFEALVGYVRKTARCNREDAEDLAQEIVLKSWTDIEEYDPDHPSGASPFTWMIRRFPVYPPKPPNPRQGFAPGPGSVGPWFYWMDLHILLNCAALPHEALVVLLLKVIHGHQTQGGMQGPRGIIVSGYGDIELSTLVGEVENLYARQAGSGSGVISA